MTNQDEPRVAIEHARIRAPEAAALLAELDRDLEARYPDRRLPGLDDGEAVVVFLLARLDGEAVGCGALVGLAPAVGEIKRMYVRPELRGHGVGRSLLNGLEAAGREQGFAILRLETGTRQPESIALYESMGYRRIPCFGAHADDPFSVCYEKRLGIA